MISRESVQADIDRLPPLPAAVVRLLALLGDPSPDVAEIERVIASDPSLAVRVLAIANSALYGGVREVGSVGAAIRRLGLRRVGELAIAVSASGAVVKDLPGFAMTPEDLARHCAAVAILARSLAGRLGLDPAIAFTAGLVHDVGKLVIDGRIAGDAEALGHALHDEGLTVVDVERLRLGTTHAEVGAWILDTWKLPPLLVDVARHHHHPSEIEGPSQPMIDVIHVANVVAHLFGLGTDVGGLARPLDPKALARLGVDTGAIEQIIAEAIPEIEGLGQQLVPATPPPPRAPVTASRR